MSKSIIVIEIPHQRPATSWVAGDKQDIIDYVKKKYTDNSMYEKLSLDDLKDFYGDENDIPAEALEIVKRDGVIFEVMGYINPDSEDHPYLSEKDAPTEFEWACGELFHDLNFGQIIENDDDLDLFKQNVTHQREKAIIAVDASRKEIEDWEQN